MDVQTFWYDYIVAVRAFFSVPNCTRNHNAEFKRDKAILHA